MQKVRITQVRSLIKKPANQKATLRALGLGRINKSVEVVLNPQISGMVAVVNHLVSVTNV
jgi:large subunit ribosomal protein L30